MELAEKIRKIEALIASTKSEGERRAAQLAKMRLQVKIAEKPLEYTVRLGNFWKKKLFVAICNKYQLKTYRYAKQKYTTAMVRVSQPFMDSVVMPEFRKYDSLFEDLANEIMQNLISKIHQGTEEDEVVIAGELPVIAGSAAL
jgi:uncharacterized protein YqiB (DUF1249 family)